MTEIPTYEYTRLVGNDSIRILLIHPEQPGSPISCSLVHTTLSECDNDIYQHFTALSYVLGDATQRRVVHVDDKAFSVTANLAAALEDIRDGAATVRLWADAICFTPVLYSGAQSAGGVDAGHLYFRSADLDIPWGVE